MFIDLISIATFLVICMIVFLIGDLIAGRRRTTYQVARAAGSQTASSEGDRKKTVIGPLTRAMASVLPQMSGEIQKIEHDLKRAGYYRSSALTEYLATRNGLIVGILILTGIQATIADPGTAMPETILLIGGLTAAFGYGLPRLLLNWQANRRVARIQKGLPDALDLIMMCITGGLPLEKSLRYVAKELRFSHYDVAIEFEIIRRQADADSMSSALKQFSQRIDAPDVNALAALVSQTERMGTHVATAVCDYADSVRRTHRQRADERANKTSLKMLFPVVLCLAPPVYILLCGPPVLKLYTFLKGAHQEGGALDPARLSSAEPLPASSEMEKIMQRRADRIRNRSGFEISAEGQSNN
jgi:tight adherence protein C